MKKLWIARDKDGCLCLHEEKPYCSANGVWYNLKQMIHLSKNLFPEVTWENSPQQVELISSEEYNRLKDIKEDWLKHIGYGPDAYD